MKHETLEHPSQTSLRSKHADLLSDVELVAQRADAARRAPQAHAAAIVEAAEVALVRVLEEWRKSRGGNQNNMFFDPLSKRLRRIIRVYRKFAMGPPGEPQEPSNGRWLYQITNYEVLPFDRLKPYFRASHVHDAIRIGISLGLRELPGLRIFPDEEQPD
jgi:hypothetical protein